MIPALGIGFLAGWIGSMPIAGAVSMFIFRRGLAGRVRDGLLLAAGAALAEGLWCVVARLGAGAVLHRWPVIASLAEGVGAVLLVVLGLYFRRLSRREPHEPRRRGVRPGVRQVAFGFVLVAANPAILVSWLAVITIVVSLGLEPLGGPPGSFALGVSLGVMGWFTLLLLILDRLRERFRPGVMGRVMGLMGWILIGAGVLALLGIWL